MLITLIIMTIMIIMIIMIMIIMIIVTILMIIHMMIIQHKISCMQWLAMIFGQFSKQRSGTNGPSPGEM